jgi:deoxyribose-phosphate aldolase
VSERDELVDAVTREVLRSLAGDTDSACLNCLGNCAAHCSGTVREVVAVGAARIAYQGDGAQVPADLAPLIDHTLLRPDATAADIDRLCAEARAHGFAAVCVNPVWVRRAAGQLRGSGVRVASVVGFPLGASTSEIKALEARRALRDGAREIDMVMNIGVLKAGDHEAVRADIAQVTSACREVGALCKVILETSLLTDEEKVIASRLAQAAKADFVKTSTGFAGGGATVFDVALLREAVGPGMGVKASGGIRTADEAQLLVAAGATRIGASAGVQIAGGGRGGDGGRY